MRCGRGQLSQTDTDMLAAHCCRVRRYHSKVGENAVHVECNPALMRILEARVGCMGHTIVQACLWNSSDELQHLHVMQESATSSLLGLQHPYATHFYTNLSNPKQTLNRNP